MKLTIKWYRFSNNWAVFIPISGIILSLILAILTVPIQIKIALWIVVMLYLLVIDQIFYLTLCDVVKENINKGNYDEIITKIISFLIEINISGKISVNKDEIFKNVCNKNFGNVSRLESKKINCILHLLKRQHYLQ